jgi:hypothetical protein
MAFNLDHTSNGNLNLAGSYVAFTGSFTFPKPAVVGSTVTFITQGAANTSSISGLQSCIDLLVPTGEIGTASTLNADNSACNAILVNNSNLIDISILPDAIKSCVFVVSNSGQLVLLSEAKKGSLATTSNPYQSYVLANGTFNVLSNWIPLLNPDNCVDSVNLKTGELFISGLDLDSSAGYGSDVESAIQLISTGYTDSTCLTTNYVTEADFNDDVIPYETTSSLTNTLLSYATTGCVSNCLSFYTNDNGTGALFAPYALESTFGTAAESQHNVGTAGSCILCVGISGCIDSSVLPDISLIETFIVSTSSSLTGLSTATIGDHAFDTVNKLNYILISSGENAYQTLSNWCQLAAEEGSLLNVNNHSADPNGIATIYSNDVCFGIPTGNESYLNVSDRVLLIDNVVFGVEDDYRSSGSFDSNRENYVLTSVFDYIASGKSVTGHTHTTSEITDLDSCLADISAFKQANQINLEESFSYTLDDSSSTTSCGSLILGQEGKAKNNYSLIQSAGNFTENGDAQYSSIVGKVLPVDNNWTNIITVDMDAGSIALLNAEFVSRNCDAFRLEGVVVKNSGSALIPDELSKSTYHTGATPGEVRVCAGASNFSLQVKGSTYWMSTLEMVSTKISGVSSSNGIGIYWQGLDNSNWFNVSGNWFTENTFTDHATSLPSGSSNVQMVGSVVPVVDLDCAAWVQPNSIDTTAITNPDGICFVSTTGAVFNGEIYGNAEFFGAVFM